MRYAVISDIHSNIEALEAVLAHIQKRGIKNIICLGDIVGYGPNPLECVKLVMEKAEVCVKGNHDEAIIEGVYLFNRPAKEAIEWSRQVLQETEDPTRENIWNFLRDLPLVYTLEEKYVFVHASPLDPTSDYILARDIVSEEKKFREIFSAFDATLFVGHTHLPCVITESLEVFDLEGLGYKYQRTEERCIINVGSVGQPRDQDPRASYVEVINDIFFFHRIPYEVEKTMAKILDNEFLNDYLAERLQQGK